MLFVSNRNVIYVPEVEECDATEAEKSDTAGFIKNFTIHFHKKISITNLLINTKNKKNAKSADDISTSLQKEKNCFINSVPYNLICRAAPTPTVTG